jgi:hydrogenase maturation protease
VSARGVVVIGVGNPVGGDDGAGIEVARRVRGRADPEFEVLELDGEPGRLIDAWEGAACAIVVDAAASGSPPGTVRRIDAVAAPLPAGLRASSTHALGVAEAVELARALGRLPASLVVYGIEGERFAAGERLSAAVEDAIDDVVDLVLADGAGAR